MSFKEHLRNKYNCHVLFYLYSLLLLVWENNLQILNIIDYLRCQTDGVQKHRRKNVTKERVVGKKIMHKNRNTIRGQTNRPVHQEVSLCTIVPIRDTSWIHFYSKRSEEKFYLFMWDLRTINWMNGQLIKYWNCCWYFLPSRYTDLTWICIELSSLATNKD